MDSETLWMLTGFFFLMALWWAWKKRKDKEEQDPAAQQKPRNPRRAESRFLERPAVMPRESTSPCRGFRICGAG